MNSPIAGKVIETRNLFTRLEEQQEGNEVIQAKQVRSPRTFFKKLHVHDPKKRRVMISLSQWTLKKKFELYFPY